MTDEEKIEQTGFEICEWGPEPDDVCEDCGKENVQMYFLGPSDAGTYWCKECVLKLYDENEADQEHIEKLEADSHSYHCSARQVLGDG